MADTSIAVTAGTGTNVDTRTESTNGNHRQVVVLGDPSVNAGVAPVDATSGLKVDLGADNDVVLSVLPDTSGGDLAAIAGKDFATQTTLSSVDTNLATVAGDTTSIDGKLPSLGQALSAASIPVVLPASQISTLTPPAAITGFATSAKQDTGNSSLGTIAGAVSGTEMQVDVLTMPTTTVQATNLDIRDLTSASDSVEVKQSTASNLKSEVTIAAAQTLAAVTSITNDVGIKDNGNSITVDGSVTADTELTTADLDTGAGTDIRAVVGLVGSKSGGGELIPGSATDGLLVNLGSNNDVTVTNGTAVNLKAEVVGTGTFAVQSTNQANSGVDIGDVTINNSTGAAAVNIQDGGNSITVDYATTGSGTATGALRVELPTNGTGVVGLNPGTNLVGKVSIDQVTANANEVVTKTGSVTTATLNAETTKVIGVVRTADGSGNLLTSTSNALDVNLKSGFNTGSGTATGAIRVELPTNGTGIVGLAAGSNAIGKLAANSGVDIGDVDVTSIAAGTNNIGQVCVAPQTANGLSVFNATSSDGATALTNSAQAIKASAGQVYGWYIYNPNSSAQFVQFYNVASASVTVGTTNPLFMLTIPATSAANVEFTNGITFSNAGFSCAATSTAGGNGAPSTALDAVIFYK